MRRQSVIQTYKTISFDNLEMLETISKFSWDRFAVWFLYICAQILVLATLLFTTATMAVHVVIMLFTILLYFITALRNVRKVRLSLASTKGLFSPIKKTHSSVLPSPHPTSDLLFSMETLEMNLLSPHSGVNEPMKSVKKLRNSLNYAKMCKRLSMPLLQGAKKFQLKNMWSILLRKNLLKLLKRKRPSQWKEKRVLDSISY
jgi:hypothetical protein